VQIHDVFNKKIGQKSEIIENFGFDCLIEPLFRTFWSKYGIVSVDSAVSVPDSNPKY
jgi:hypothetical protein